MVHGDFKELKRITQSDKVLKDKTFAIQAIRNMTDIKED